MTEDLPSEDLPEFEDQNAQASTGSSRLRKVIIGAGVLFLCLCLGLIAVSLSDAPDDTEEKAETGETAVPVAEEDEAESAPDVTSTPAPPTATPAPTDTPEPTETPVPTETPIPTETPDPNLISAGTYLVGEDIEPGLYRGDAGDSLLGCYWERLSDLSGEFESIIANDNAVGQFYVEVVESDEALQSDCALRYLPELPAAAESFPSQIEPGSYLVGIDIQPGRYRGEGGTDALDSCYWERVSNFRGEFSSIISNDNGMGQFFVDVVPGDFGLTTACELTLVE